eukprot:6184694-Pleurochrysis_carterae.AAC.4
MLLSPDCCWPRAGRHLSFDGYARSRVTRPRCECLLEMSATYACDARCWIPAGTSKPTSWHRKVPHTYLGGDTSPKCS